MKVKVILPYARVSRLVSHIYEQFILAWLENVMILFFYGCLGSWMFALVDLILLSRSWFYWFVGDRLPGEAR